MTDKKERPLRQSDQMVIYSHDGEDKMFILLDGLKALEMGQIVTPARRLYKVLGIASGVMPSALELELLIDYSDSDEEITVDKIAEMHSAYISTLVQSDDDPIIRESSDYACCILEGEERGFFLRDQTDALVAELFVTPSRKVMRVTGVDDHFHPSKLDFELWRDFAAEGSELTAKAIAEKLKCPLAIEVGSENDKVKMTDREPWM